MRMRIVIWMTGGRTGDNSYFHISPDREFTKKITDKVDIMDVALRSTDVSIQPQYSNSDCPEQSIISRFLAPQPPCSTYTGPTDSCEPSGRLQLKQLLTEHLCQSHLCSTTGREHHEVRRG